MENKKGKSLMDEATQNELAKLEDLLEQNEAIQRFKRAEHAVNANQKLVELQEEIKIKQKEAANLDYYEKPEGKRMVDEEVDKMTADLETQPLVIEYQTALQEANDVLQVAVNRISKGVNERLEKGTLN